MRKDRQRDEEFALNVLRNCEYATFATVNPDGTPYCVPISPVVTGNIIYFHCALEGKKLDNLTHSDYVCVSGVGRTKLVPEKYTTEFESAVAVGKCKMVVDEKEKIMVLRLITEKYAADHIGKFEKIISHSLAKTGIARIDLVSITGKENLM